MLNAPGANRNRPTPRSNRRKTQESPEEQLRALQRSNKKCADCSTKLPQCVNLTLGTFVCMACSGIHRELNMRVKGIGASTFTQEEVDKLKETSNDQVNAVYLARYNPAVERLEAPTNNYDQQRLRLWIRRKYHDKAWYSMEPQATRVQIPPKQEAKAQDLLGFSGAAPTPAASASQQWDAFNGSSQQQQQQVAFPADFGSSQTKQQQNFAAFGQQPPHQQQQQSFAAFGQQPAQQQNFADFGQQQNFAAFGQQQQPQQQQQGQFLNYAGQPQANAGQTQPPPSQPQPQAVQFANFGQQQQQFGTFPQSSQQQLPPQPGTYAVQQQQPRMSDHQAGFGAFSQHQGVTQPFQQEQQATGGLSNFSQQGVGAPVSMQAPAPPVPPSVTHEPVSETSGDRIGDAFSNLSVTPIKPKESPANPVATKGKEEPKYSSGGSAIYTSNGDKSVVKIIKVHLDHELEPFYTIQLPDGREKQTDDAHLSDFVETAEAKVIANLLIDLDVTQLKKVVEFVRSLKSASGSDSSSNAPHMPGPSIPALSVAPPMPPSAMPPAPNMAPPAPPLSPPATVPAPAQMGQMLAPAAGGMMGMQSGISAQASMIPSPNPGSNQTQGDGVPMGGVPAPPLYQQPGVGQQQPPQQQYMQQPPPQQQQYMQQQPPQQQQYMQQPPQQQQYMQQQPPQQQQHKQQQPPQQQQQQYMQQMPPQQQPYMQQPTQQYMQQQAMPPQETPPQQMPGGAPISPRGNPFDMYH